MGGGVSRQEVDAGVEAFGLRRHFSTEPLEGTSLDGMTLAEALLREYYGTWCRTEQPGSADGARQDGQKRPACQCEPKRRDRGRPHPGPYVGASWDEFVTEAAPDQDP
jgi:hypothetical protein